MVGFHPDRYGKISGSDKKIETDLSSYQGLRIQMYVRFDFALIQNRFF